MKYSGQISKMNTSLNATVQYELPINNHCINLNQYIGSMIEITFDNQIHCIKCNASIKKTFMQGYCYPCFISIPETSECILKPHLCRAHEGISRNIEWSKIHCLTDNYIYLSHFSPMKIEQTLKVKSLIIILLNPEPLIILFSSDLDGKCFTDSGRYLYPSDLEINAPTLGNICLK